MNVIDTTGIKEENAKKMVKALNGYLANLHVHYSNLRGFHWHIEGINFFGMHAKLEELYDEAFEQIDAVAERILMLDGTPVRIFSDIEKSATIKETEVVKDDKKIIKHLLDAFKILIEQEREIIALSDEIGDVTTNDLITGHLTAREKTTWMFTALTK
ncbi:Dps family protein [uncultured Porphyromonas sp.]|uniref:Dps family protein n=1 Tax=uncultured Porphyromonas sp. TaxID=159274 RepID=UPI002639F4DE|nr:Dps family protein [uncultured Porphyromonas sp.]